MNIAGLGIGFEELSIFQTGNDTLVAINEQELAVLSELAADSLNTANFVFI
ncbi:hypothetical protein [Myxosarcina sp. GI1]|uniref:hypothetical protein n=1 Tax=Myxosarcina sp. GI1 TaxID=1541065 RepID=UPI0012E01243|nr:hypothetical protein [Myxosarcina sp. GI1]